MFTDIPPRYDLINRLMTLNMDRSWRRLAALECLSSRPKVLLDLCCGTGDLSVTTALLADYQIHIRGLDYSLPMLEIAARKASALKAGNIAYIRGNAACLPFTDASLDCIGISFAFRNLTYKNTLAEKHLAEILRVLKPGGKLVIVESSQPQNALIRSLDHLYLRLYAYSLGAIVSGNRAAYRYLAESTTRFYSPHEMRNLLIGTGFSSVAYRPLFFGAAGIYSVIK
ncbi:MAG: ubiquinone/menaquinone biosynthesis methyltransferase [Dehalococcoidales bacterium]|nr:ubiquinone/menaquinone biosynthesis methyltransferase [Dehalococcoidales bacterium]